MIFAKIWRIDVPPADAGSGSKRRSFPRRKRRG
jgi:hypothetical protein